MSSVSLRKRLEQTFWEQFGLHIVIEPPIEAPSVLVFPVILPNHIKASDVDKVIEDVAGRLGLGAILTGWLEDGHFSLEVPRQNRARVQYESLKITDNGLILPWLIGINNYGKVLLADVTEMPHMLIAGVTGAGKSNAMAASLAHLISTRSPHEVQLVLLDPKLVDLLPFRDVPHTISHMTALSAMPDALTKLTNEMQRRYRLFNEAGVQNLEAYNKRAEPLPRVLCVIDELAAITGDDDVGKPFAAGLYPLLQTARAAGIHLIIATQRPDSKTIPPRLRANMPTQTCFHVNDNASSRVVLNRGGGEHLLGKGDGLFRNAEGLMLRFQAPFLSDDARNAVIGKAQQYAPVSHAVAATADAVPIPKDLPPLEQAKLFIQGRQDVNATHLVEAGIVGSPSAGRYLMQDLRKAGFIGANDPSKKASPVLSN